MRSTVPLRAARALLPVLLVLLLLLAGAPASADQRIVEPDRMPAPLSGVSFEQQLGADLPLDASFRDEDGRTVRLGDLWGERPVLLAFVYYECPMLCTLILNGLASSLAVLEFEPGREFDVVAISIDPEETPAMAAEAKAETLDRYGREGTAEGWHFLVGDEAEIARVAGAAGFGYELIPRTGEWAHASGIVVTTEEGRIAQYYYGVEYPPKDLRLALVEASEKKIGNLVDQVLLYCYRYDPQVGKYTAFTMRLLRVTGGLFALGLIAFLWYSFRHDRAAQDAPRSDEAGTLGAV